MKIGYLSSFTGLETFLNEHQSISELIVINTTDEIDTKMGGIILDEMHVHVGEIVALREKYPLMNILVLAKEQVEERLQTVCAAQEIDLLKVTDSLEHIITFIETEWLHLQRSDYKNVISISGTHPQVGVTQTVHGLANALTSLNYRTAVLGLNLYNPGEIAIEVAEYTLDSIYSSLANRMFTKEKIVEVMQNFDNYSYLPGNRNVRHIRLYKLDTIEYLINQVKDEFDVVLLDLGSIYDTAAALGGIYYSSKHILVGTQQEISSRSFKRWSDQIFSDLSINTNDFHLVINKYTPSSIITSKQLSEEINVPLIGTIPYVAGAENIEHEDGTIAYKSHIKPYMKALTGIGKAVVVGEESAKKKKRLLGVGI